MRDDQIEALKAQQARLTAELQAMLNTPEDERPQDAKALRAWVRELEANQRALEQLSSLLSRGEKAQARAAKQEERRAAPSTPTSSEEVILLASIPKSITGAEVRVTLQTWTGRRTVDIRTWMLLNGEMRPSRKGVQVDIKRLPALLDALKLAQQHV